ncbi:MAG: tetratricopeptide repeat protein [Tannerellaceae bacterium]|nr:tetratricopeptide repeat protein [Tannerellaceae bacterium]
MYLNRTLSLPGGREWQSGRAIVNLANSYGFQGRYADALKLYLEALEVSEELVKRRKNVIEASINIVRTMANMSEIHYLTGNHLQAMHYAERARDMEAGQPSYITPQYLYIIASVHLYEGRWEEAEEAMRRMRDIALNHPNPGNNSGMYMYIAYGFEGMARVALARGDHPLALGHATEAMNYAERHGDLMTIAKMLATMSDIHLARGDHEQSGLYARRVLETYPDYTKLNPGVLFNLASTSLQEKSEPALDYLRLYSERMKENADRQFRETMAGMEVVYETEKKETRIAMLEQQKVLYIAISMVGLLLAVFIWFFLLQKIKNERREKQLAATNAVLEWEKKERKRFASDLHDGINGMLAAIKLELSTVSNLQSIRDRLDECIEAIRAMSRSKMPNTLQRYGIKSSLEDYCRLFPNIDFHFYGVDKRMNEMSELTIYYCAYELITNALRHSGAKNINVQLVQNGTSVSLTVQDDGCGFDEQNVEEGSGLKSIRDRIASLNGKIDVSTSPGKGTETNIELSIKNA